MHKLSKKVRADIAIAIIASATIIPGNLAFAEMKSESRTAGCSAKQENFKAWIDQMPMAAHKVIVVGKVQCPTTGWQVTLAEQVPPGINPSILILNLKAKAPSGMAGQVVTTVDVRFERNAGKGYQEATIRGGGPDFSIPVDIVH